MTVGESVFQMLFCITISKTVLLLFEKIENTVLLLVVNFFNFLDYCREFEAAIFCLHHCVRARLLAMLHLLPP